MNKIIKIAIREYNAAIRTKAFIIMLVLMPVMFSGGLIAVKIMEEQVDTTDKRIAVVDHTGQLAHVLVRAAKERNESQTRDQDTGKKAQPAYLIEVVPPESDIESQRLALSDRVRSNKLYAFIEIGPDVIHPTAESADAEIAYHAENAALHDARRWVDYVLNGAIRKARLEQAGLDVDLVNSLSGQVRVESMGLVSRDVATGHVIEAKRSNEGAAIGVPLAMMMLMFMMITVGATPLINAVLEEKMQRIAEVLLGSASPSQIMYGKLLGTVAVSLTIVAIYIAGGVYAAHRMDFTDLIPFEVFPWFAVYLISAILMFGALFIAIGSAVNDLKEAQSMMLPVWLLVMVPMFVWLNVAKEPLSNFAVTLSMIPPFTPMLMLIRQASPATIPLWQPSVALVGVLLFTALCVFAAGRIFRVGILLQGKTPKVTDLIKWAVRG